MSRCLEDTEAECSDLDHVAFTDEDRVLRLLEAEPGPPYGEADIAPVHIDPGPCRLHDAVDTLGVVVVGMRQQNRFTAQAVLFQIAEDLLRVSARVDHGGLLRLLIRDDIAVCPQIPDGQALDFHGFVLPFLLLLVLTIRYRISNMIAAIN